MMQNTFSWNGRDICCVEVHKTLPSTNTHGKNLLRSDAPNGTVIWALEQTQGKGRLGREWLSNNGSLTFSIIWRFSRDFAVECLPLAVGLLVAKALNKYSSGIKVKWPNDLWYGKRKLAGILGEGVWTPNGYGVVMGIGINVGGSGDALLVEAVSLQEITGQKLLRFVVLCEILESIDRGFRSCLEENTDWNEEFLKYGNFLGQELTVTTAETTFWGKAVKVDVDGSLLVETSAGLKVVRAGDCSIRPTNPLPLP